MINTLLAIVGILLALLAGIVVVRDFLTIRRKHTDASLQILNMACEHLFQEGCLEALRQQGMFLSTKARRKLAYERAEGYAQDFPCDVPNYDEQLAHNFSEGYQEEQERLQQPQRNTTTRQRIVSMDGTKLYPLVDEQDIA